jgi:hypothetical protein
MRGVEQVLHGNTYHGNIAMTDNDRKANTKMRAVQSPAGISQDEGRRDTRAQLFRACSLLALALVIGAAALFLSHGGAQDTQLSSQAARSTIDPGAR